ncbi:protein DEK-like isoform X2 [Liolophura sinensis]|uniref:protein DEK-like isoform X2 n=1 Tax=Liolophura sinensis TaxID=3198878 RepID=UPI003158475A
MSDGDTSESPQKEQVPMEEGEEEKKPVEDKPADVSTESKEEEAATDTTENEAEPITDKETSDTADSPAKKTTIKKIPKKKQLHEYVEDDEERLGLLERPVIIESGKREKRKVERLEMTGAITPNLQKKKVEVPEGTGMKLGDCPRIEHQLQKSRGEDLKVLHRILFGRVSTPGMVKKNIRQFCGFPFSKGDKEHDKKIAILVKLNMPVLKFICEVIDVERSGHKDDVVNRIMDFLLHPKSSGKEVPVPKKRKSSGKADNKKGVKRKRKSSGKKGKAAEKKAEVELSDSELDLSPDEEEEGSEPDEKGDAPAKDDEEASEESEEEEEAPKKKKQKTEKRPKKEKVVKETKKEKPEKKVKEKVEKKVKEKPEKKVKEKVEKKEKKAASPKKPKVSKDVEDDSSEDDEPLSKKQSSEPPSDEDVKECIKKILEGANLEEVTMKTVLKQVYETYPDFDLSDRKTFIKNTVKQLIS